MRQWCIWPLVTKVTGGRFFRAIGHRSHASKIPRSSRVPGEPVTTSHFDISLRDVIVIFSWSIVVTVCFREVSSSRSFHCGCTPIHPFVNTPARKQSLRSGKPDTEYVFRPSRRRKGRLIHTYAQLMVKSTGLLRLALRREDLPT